MFATYILKASLCWLIFYAFYLGFLKSHTFFQWNRFYLLLTLSLGLVIPTLEWPTSQVPTIVGTTAEQYLATVTVGIQQLESQVIESQQVSNWNFTRLLWWLYGAGVLATSVAFLSGLWNIVRLIRGAKIRREQGYYFVATSQPHAPFSFFNFLFWSNEHQVLADDREKIIRHELAHIQSKHSLDVIFVEMLCILLWFNPLIYWYRKSLRTVHEYQADAAVLKNTQRKQYGHLLIRQSQSGLQIALANHFIHSQLKQRFIMMKKRKSKRYVLSRYLLLLPMLFMMTLLFSKSSNLENLGQDALQTLESSTTALLTGEVDQYPRFAGCEDQQDEKAKDACSKKKLFEFILNNLKYPKEAKVAGISGKVVLGFAIDTDGSVTDIRLLKDIGGGCGQAAIDVLEAMPKWTPGLKDGKAVKVEMKLPFLFEFEKEAKLGNNSVRQDVIKIPDTMPLFPGCSDKEGKEAKKCSDTKLIQFIGSQMKYPADAKKAGIEGMAIASFIVGTDGNILDVQIERSLTKACDEEVLRVVKMMNELPEAWTPGTLDGKAVKTIMKLPVKFKLTDKEKKQYGLNVEPLELKNFKAAPNPTSGLVNISFQADEQPIELLIIDLSGKTLISKDISDFDGALNLDLDLSKYPAGTYLLRINQGNKVFNERIVVQ